MTWRRWYHIFLTLLALVLTLGGGPAEADPLNPTDFATLGDFPSTAGAYLIDTASLTLSGPGGQMLFVGVEAGEIAVFTFNAITIDDMIITVVGPRPLALLSKTDVTISGTGVIDGSRGGGAAAGQGPVSVTVDPTGRFAYVANYDSNDMSMHSIAPASGELIAIEPWRAEAGIHPLAVRVDPFSQFAYVANYHSRDVSMYRIEPTSGQLIALEPGRVEARSGPTVVTTTNPFDNLVQQDMLDRAAHDARFGEPWYGTFGKDLASDPEWEVRGMSFAFAGGRAVFMVHATSKINRSRWTNYQDPETGQLAGWESVV
jgi:hypothetical protein